MPRFDQMKIILRDYQETAVGDVRIAFRDHKAVLLVLSTGAGKTIVFSKIAKSAAERNRNVLILAHRDQLIKQASNKLRDNEVEHGIIMAGYTPKPFCRVQVASVQTLVRRLESTKFVPDLIIIDEAHLSAAASYVKIVSRWPNAKILGVTGSPIRLDNKPLGTAYGGLYDYMVKGISIGKLIERGFLVKPKVFGAQKLLDLSGVKTSMGDYQTDALADIVDRPHIIGAAVQQYVETCPNMPAVAWCVTIQHAANVAAEFNAAGIPAVMLCGEDDSARRDLVLNQLSNGEIKVVTFVGILVEGVDCPAISAIILLRPTKSLASYLQVIGRGLRPHTFASGVVKDVCYVLDHASMWREHGFADEERDWSLDVVEKKRTKKKKDDEEAVSVKQCPKCFLCHVPAPICPDCGHVYEVKGRKLEHVDGKLVEITDDLKAQQSKQAKREVGKAQTLEELERIAAERGYKKSWAKHVFESRNRRRAPEPPPVPPMEELLQMSLEQLENLANQQGWPANWASDFFHSKPTETVEEEF